jgi:hypothetical protein
MMGGMWSGRKENEGGKECVNERNKRGEWQRDAPESPNPTEPDPGHKWEAGWVSRMQVCRPERMRCSDTWKSSKAGSIVIMVAVRMI